MTPNDLATVEYLNGLQVGEHVVETCKTSCMNGMKGVVYRSEQYDCLCVLWENGCGTSVTHGTRRVSDVQPGEGETPKTICYSCHRKIETNDRDLCYECETVGHPVEEPNQ